ncbi:MAG: PAS domain S-box protein, partial [Candidatus Omnitrophica bacterium]|nr:PAS domain S-box protein [Candidatus Omnitrophota bacterium]
MADGSRKSGINIIKDIPHDIIERKKAQEESIRDRECLSLAQEAAVAGSWCWDMLSGKVWWPPEYYALYGLDPKKIKPSYNAWIKSIHPDDREYAHKTISEALKKKKKKKNDIDITFRILHPKKGLRWINARGRILYGEKGNASIMAGVSIDITEHKKAQEELERQHIEHLTILDSVPALIFYKDKENNLVRVNKGLADAMGLKKEEIEGKSCFDIWPKKQAEDFWRDDKKVMQSGMPKLGIIEPMMSPKGQRWVQTDKIPYRNEKEKIIGIIGFAVDITERKKAEENLHKVNRTLKALSHSNQALIKATNEQKYLQQICGIIVKDCGYALVWIGLAEQDKDKSVRPVMQAGFEKGYLKKLNITWADTERGRGPTGTAIRTGRPVICKNILTDPIFKPWRKEAVKRGYASLVALPLVTNQKAFGAICIYSKEPDAFIQDEVKLLIDLADDLAYGITAIRLRFAHKQSEEQLRESEIKFRLAFENAQDAMLWADTKTGILIDCNSAAERLFERPKSEIIGQHQMMLHPAEARRYCRQMFKKHASEKTSSIIDLPIITKSGKIKTAMISATVVKIKGKKVIQGIFRDITERKEMETGLARSNAQLSAIFDNVTEGLIISDLDGNLIYLNPVAVAMHGFADMKEGKRQFVEFTKTFELSTKEKGVLPVEEWPLARILKGEVLHSFEVNIRRLDRKWPRVFSYGGTLARDKDDKPILAVVTAVDITERKQAEEALRLTQFSVDHANDAIAWVDKDARFVYVNERYRQSLGYSRKELSSMHVYDIDLKFTKKVWKKHWEVIKKQGSFRTESLHRAKNGWVFPIEVSANYFKLGDKEYNFTFIRDISERKQAEEALTKAHNELELRVRQRTAELTEANRNISYRNEILKLIGVKSSRKEFLEAVIELLKAWSACRCIGIRVLDAEGRIPYDAYTGFSREFWESENWLSIKEDQCACIRVIKGKPEPQDLPGMTKAGSFYSNNALKFMDSLSKHAKARFRGVCVRAGFKSLAVIPIRNRNETYGAIHFADPKEGVLPLEKVEFLESMTGLIGEGIHKFNLEEKILRDHTLLDAFFKHAINPFVFLDTEFNFIRVNEAYAKSCMRDVSEFPGHNQFEFYPHEENEKIFREVVRTKTPFHAFAKPFVFPEHPEQGVTYWDWTLVHI